MKKNNQKKKIFIVCILVILGIFLIVCTAIIHNYEQEEKDYETKTVDGQYTQKDLDLIDESINNYIEDKVVPTGISRLYGKYKGKNELSDLYRGIKKVCDYIPTISENLSGKTDTELKDYYKVNKDEVLKSTGINKEEDFIEFAKYILEFDSLQTRSTAAIETSTINGDDEALTFDLKLGYENGQEVVLKAYFKNVDDKKDELFKFTVSK